MRESNFAFPAQNKACVCITSQLYDRRALDTTSALPLFNSLTHLTYLTSTSPRIREIMTMDGGLERLVRILHEFCMCPPPPDNPTILYGLTPPNARPSKLIPTLNPQSFDKHAAYRFSLAFQCVVNIGVRGSEPIRSRVVQAGTLDVVGCILEAWLANKGFAVGPSSSATGIPRESREQRQARRNAQAEQRQREEAAHLARALQRQIQVDQSQYRAHRPQLRTTRLPEVDHEDDAMDVSIEADSSLILSIPGPSASGSDTDVSTTVTPIGSGTPTGAVVVPSRDRSGTIIARPVWDRPSAAVAPATLSSTSTITPRHRSHRRHDHGRLSPTPSTDTSRPETETEDDGDVDMDRADRSDQSTNNDSDVASASASPSPERHPNPHRHPRLSLGRRAVGIVSDAPSPQGLPVGNMELEGDAHIIINEAGGVGDVGGVGVEDGIVSLEPNDDFAMGAPPGAPGAMDEGATPRGMGLEGMRRRGDAPPDVTPRAGVIGLPMVGGNGGRDQQPHHHHHHHHQRNGTIRGRANTAAEAANTANAATAAAAAATASLHHASGRTSSSHHHRDSNSGPYRDDDVLLSLQLLAYLSKYAHVRQAFYKPRVTFHPASANLPGARYGVGANGIAGPSVKEKAREKMVPIVKESHGFFRAFASGRGKEKEKVLSSGHISPVGSSSVSMTQQPTTVRQTNVFSLVERFTFKPSSTETDLPNPPPRLPPEIQYWAGVIMRNACRKDDTRGGIRQCANMLCGRWESYPREFAKCRRCRKAKYCGKECQSTAWSEGHRFWCSARDGDEDAAEHSHEQDQELAGEEDAGDDSMMVSEPVIPVAIPARRERHVRERTHDPGTVRGAAVGQRPPSASAVFAAGPSIRPQTAERSVVTLTSEAQRMLQDIQPGAQYPSHASHAETPGQPPVRVIRALDLRPGVNPNTWLTFELHPDGPRRRAETIAGVAPLQIPPHPQARLQPNPERYFAAQASPARPEAGPSRRRRDGGFRSPAEDRDMVLG